MIRCIVGLGNPGVRYAATRHNLGFHVIDLVARRAGRVWKKRWWRNYSMCILDEPRRVICCKPATYMNMSGRAVAAAARKYGLAAEELLVVHDDVHLPVGRLRARARGSAGGHNGLQSVIDEVGTEDIPRLRLGIGEGGNDRVAHVLSPFDPAEEAAVGDMVDAAADAVCLLLTAEWDMAVRRINSF